MKRTRYFVAVLALSMLCRGAVAQQPPTGIDRLKDAIVQVLDEVEGEMGVAITHVETGQFLEVNGTKGYPMASTFKLPILVELFNQVDQGKLSLDEMISIDPQDLHLGSGQLRRFVVPGVSLSVENLALLMMRISDNSATDMLLKRVGVDNVNRRLAEIGVEGMSVDRSCQRLILDWLGFDIERTHGMSYKEIEAMLNDYEPQPGEMEAAAAAFVEDPQDTATPAGMNLLLEKIFKGSAASPAACEKMTEILLGCETGRNRIRGLLPSSVDVAHKTGTIGGTVNNVGIIYLPHKRGHVIVSVLSKKMEDREEAERAIAEIARYAFDYFLFTAPESQKEEVEN